MSFSAINLQCDFFFFLTTDKENWNLKGQGNWLGVMLSACRIIAVLSDHCLTDGCQPPRNMTLYIQGVGLTS